MDPIIINSSSESASADPILATNVVMFQQQKSRRSMICIILLTMIDDRIRKKWASSTGSVASWERRQLRVRGSSGEARVVFPRSHSQ